MKKLIFYSALILVSLSAQPVIENSIEGGGEEVKQSDWFLGVGLGGGVERLESIWKPNPRVTDRWFGIFVVSAKAGGYHSLNPWINIRYYYNFDLSFNPGDPYYSPRQIASLTVKDSGFYMLSQSHTLNADLLLKLYAHNHQSFDLIVGLGLGVSLPQFRVRKGSQTWSLDELAGYVIDFQTRINTGFQWKINQKYALELIAKVPITPRTIIKPSLKDQKLVKYDPSLNLTFDFVMKL